MWFGADDGGLVAHNVVTVACKVVFTTPTVSSNVVEKGPMLAVRASDNAVRHSYLSLPDPSDVAKSFILSRMPLKTSSSTALTTK